MNRPWPEVLETDRLVLRPFRPGDAPALYAAAHETREALFEWTPWVDAFEGLPAAEAAIARYISQTEAGIHRILAVLDRSEGRLLGGAGFYRIDANVPSSDVGYWLRSGATGQGLATEAVRALTRCWFEGMGGARLALVVDVLNRRSRAVAERLGFPFEGVQRDASRLRGELRSLAVYALTCEDYEADPRLPPGSIQGASAR